jgi:hypothetical protein
MHKHNFAGGFDPHGRPNWAVDVSSEVIYLVRQNVRLLEPVESSAWCNVSFNQVSSVD